MPWVSEGGLPPYIDTVKRCLTDEKMFSVFKHLNAFSRMVGISEHVHAVHCYKHLLKFPEVFKNIDAFRRNDVYGRPYTTRLIDGTYGRDTLRFAESVCYLYDKFHDLSGKRIVEMGSNYGGLCYVLLTQWADIKAYHLIDLPEVQDLSRKYLSTLGLNHPALTWDEPTEPADIFISEYALTEYTDADMYAYYQKYCQSAVDGFLIRCNLVDPVREEAFLAVLRRDFHLSVTSEPAVRGCNKIVVGYR